MFIAASFIIDKMWKQTKYSPIDEWISEIWCVYVCVCVCVCMCICNEILFNLKKEEN